MKGIVCERCGEGLLINEDVRYEMKIEVTAAYDPMELTAQDLEASFRDEYERILAGIDGASAGELEDQVHFTRQMDLCGACRRALIEFLSGKNEEHPG